MSKFTLVESLGRGRPRTNTSDLTGNVRIMFSLAGYEGNCARGITVADAKVSAVYKAVVAALESGKIRPVAPKPRPAAKVAAVKELVAAAS